MSEPRDQRRRQLFRAAGSLFESDVYETYTAAYAWASNQAAHTGLGYLAATTVAALWPWAHNHGWVLFIPYIGKEGIDLFTASRTFKGAFRIPVSELVFDSVADSCFFSIGVAFLFLSTHGWIGIAETVGLLLLAALVFGLHFMPQKRAFDKAGLPYFYRLGRYDGHFSDEIRDCINDFIAGEGQTRCLVITGKAGSGKTTFAVAVASEFTVHQKYALYLPATRVFEAVAGKKHKSESKLNEPWTIGEADIMAIDDCVEFRSPKDVQATLKDKRLIWVLSALADAAAVSAAIESAFGPIKVIEVDKLHYKPPPM